MAPITFQVGGPPCLANHRLHCPPKTWTILHMNGTGSLGSAQMAQITSKPSSSSLSSLSSSSSCSSCPSCFPPAHVPLLLLVVLAPRPSPNIVCPPCGRGPPSRTAGVPFLGAKWPESPRTVFKIEPRPRDGPNHLGRLLVAGGAGGRGRRRQQPRRRATAAGGGAGPGHHRSAHALHQPGPGVRGDQGHCH